MVALVVLLLLLAVFGGFGFAAHVLWFVLLVAVSGQVPDFFFHYRLHQRQSCFAHQVAHAFLQQADDVG